VGGPEPAAKITTETAGKKSQTRKVSQTFRVFPLPAQPPPVLVKYALNALFNGRKVRLGQVPFIG
jgi:hypothetical protein